MKKFLVRLAVFLLFTAVFPLTTTGAGIDIYGELGIILAYMDKADSFTPEPGEVSNLGTNLQGNLYFSSIDKDLFHYLLALDLEGSLTGPAKVSVGVDQFYIQMPLSQRSFLYGGKKRKEKGISHFFNVANRISPQYLSDYEYERSAPGFIEAAFIHSHVLSHSYMLYFQDANRWEEVSAAAFVDLCLRRLTLDGFFYLEKLSDPMAGFSLSYQKGVFQYYMEALWKREAEQMIIAENSPAGPGELALRDQKNPVSAIFGIKTIRDDWSFVLEFLHRQEGCNYEEQKTFIEYIKNSGQTGSSNNHLPHNLLRNYLGVSFSMNSIKDSRLSAESVAIFSFQPDVTRFRDYASWQVLTQIGYEITQNSVLSFHIQTIEGGKYGEFNNLIPQKKSYALMLKHYF